jgi:hypothetical protein
VGGRSRGRYATPAGFLLHDDTGGYTYDVGVWDLSIVQGPFSVAPCQTLASVTIRNFASLYTPASLIFHRFAIHPSPVQPCDSIHPTSPSFQHMGCPQIRRSSLEPQPHIAASRRARSLATRSSSLRAHRTGALTFHASSTHCQDTGKLIAGNSAAVCSSSALLQQSGSTGEPNWLVDHPVMGSSRWFSYTSSCREARNATGWKLDSFANQTWAIANSGITWRGSKAAAFPAPRVSPLFLPSQHKRTRGCVPVA